MNRNLSGQQFGANDMHYTFEPTSTFQANDPHAGHRVVATHPVTGAVVGDLEWNKHNGRVDMVKVAPDHRRKGIATRLWHESNMAAQKNNLVKPQHSDVRFPDGQSWIQGMTATRNKPPKRTRQKAAPDPDQGGLF